MRVIFVCVPAELVMYWIGCLCSSTERAKARLWKHQYIDYGYEIPDNVMALLLGLTFCIISPLIAPIALLYFVVNSVIGKYTLIYVYAERFQSGGKVGLLTCSFQVPVSHNAHLWRSAGVVSNSCFLLYEYVTSCGEVPLRRSGVLVMFMCCMSAR